MLRQSPRGHRDPGFLAAKLERLDEPHVRPIQDLVRRIRAHRGDEAVPFVDPDCGGVHARVLLLLEAPAAAAAHGSTLLSPDNDDATAANVWRLYQDSGLRREHALHWNAVPWYIGGGGRIRAANRHDLTAGHVWLTELTALLTRLRLVIAMGAAARDAFGTWQLTNDTGDLPVLAWLAVPHPSQRVLNTTPTAWHRPQTAFTIAARVATARRRGLHRSANPTTFCATTLPHP